MELQNIERRENQLICEQQQLSQRKKNILQWIAYQQQQRLHEQRVCKHCKSKSNGRKYCQECADSRVKCETQDCKVLCGPGYVKCFHCNKENE